jgi:hypothetical protein
MMLLVIHIAVVALCWYSNGSHSRSTPSKMICWKEDLP